MTTMATAEEAPDWLTKEEAARYLRIHPDTLRRLALKGTVRRFGSGKRQRYRRIDLEEYLHNLT